MRTTDNIINTLRIHKADIYRLGVQNIGLFGSYARGEQSHNSDIDILIDFDPEKENFETFMKVCEYFEQLFKNEKVEVITRNGLSPYIGPEILKEVVYV
ncbi:hypothetical protein ES705_34845 [subsurface metagenome]